jgi:hypothetical protein
MPFQGFGGNTPGANLFGDLEGLRTYVDDLNAYHMPAQPVGCQRACDKKSPGCAAAPPASTQENCCTDGLDKSCAYSCNTGSRCSNYAKACQVSKYPAACGNSPPRTSGCFPGIPTDAPGMAGSWAGYDVLSTGACGTNEYFRHMNEARMARESPTALSVCVNRELDVPFQDCVVPSKPLPVTMAGTDVFGTIGFHSSARGATLDMRGEEVKNPCVGPPPPGAGVSGRMARKACIPDIPECGCDCEYSNELLDPPCRKTRGGPCDDYDDSTEPITGRNNSYRLPSASQAAIPVSRDCFCNHSNGTRNPAVVAPTDPNGTINEYTVMLASKFAEYKNKVASQINMLWSKISGPVKGYTQQAPAVANPSDVV